jgi:hypothetical protein
MESVTEKLAKAAVEMTYEVLPKPVVSEAKRCLIDWVGVTLGAQCGQEIRSASCTGIAYPEIDHHDRRCSLQSLVPAEGLEISPTHLSEGRL